MVDEGKIFGRSIAFPPRIGPDGRMAFSEGAQNIRESIQIIILTETQERLMLPRFGGGLKSFLFKPNIADTHRQIQERIDTALRQWEPRIQVESITVVSDSEDEFSALVTINYILVATGAGDRLNVTVNLEG